MYLVTGATGNVGHEVAAALIDAGEEVRALVRSADAALPAGAAAAVGDLDHPDTVGPALDGVRGLFLLPGYSGQVEVLRQAAAAGVQRLVLLSGRSADSGDRSNAVSRYMIDSEAAARESGIPLTVLRPSMFASNALQWRDQLRRGDVVTAPFAHAPAAVIHPADIGAVAAISLTDDQYAGHIHRLSGPESMLPAERLAVLAEALDRDLRFVAQPDDEARREMEAAMPKGYVDAFFDFYVTGSLDESPVLRTVAEITGHPPRTFRDWAADNSDRFR